MLMWMTESSNIFVNILLFFDGGKCTLNGFFFPRRLNSLFSRVQEDNEQDSVSIGLYSFWILQNFLSFFPSFLRL